MGRLIIFNRTFLESLGCQYVTHNGLEAPKEFSGFCPINDGSVGRIAFCDHISETINLKRKPLSILEDTPQIFSLREIDMMVSLIEETKASLIICPIIVQSSIKFRDDAIYVFVQNPRLAFMNLLEAFLPDTGCSVHPSAVIYHERVFLGLDVKIGANCVIGGEGFGMWRTQSGSIRKFPQIGRVIIGDNVELQSGVCVDRGALGDTVIGEGTKIDNLVHIGHNVIVGKHCVIVANSMIGGGVRIGNETWIGPSVTILNGIRIGRKCVVGIASLVLRDVADDEVVKGVVK